MRLNKFIASALEEINQELSLTEQNATEVTTPNVGEVDKTVTETNIETSDTVAELMEQNVELASENIELQSENFDNDVDALDSASDSVQQDLDEAVAAGVALEELAYLA